MRQLFLENKISCSPTIVCASSFRPSQVFYFFIFILENEECFISLSSLRMNEECLEWRVFYFLFILQDEECCISFHPWEWRVFSFFFILENEWRMFYFFFILQNEECFISFSSFRMNSVFFHPQEWRAVLRRWTESCTWWAGASRPWSHATARRSSILSPGRYLCHFWISLSWGTSSSGRYFSKL